MSKAATTAFLRFSDAVTSLAQGIWGGLRRPGPVVEIKKHNKGQGSITYGPWKEMAGERLTLAALSNQIPVYVYGRPQAAAGDRKPDFRRVPGAVLGALINPRGCLPDHPRASMKAAGGNGELYRALNTGLLLVRKREFDAWYRRERQKGSWPSQRDRLKKEGRPSRQTVGLRNAVTAILQERKISIAELRRRLVTLGRNKVPSEDTLARLVDQLYRETGDPIFRRRKRARRQERAASRKTP